MSASVYTIPASTAQITDHRRLGMAMLPSLPEAPVHLQAL